MRPKTERRSREAGLKAGDTNQSHQEDTAVPCPYWITRTLYVVDVGVPAAMAQRRTVTVPLEETKPIQEKPAPGSAAGETLTDMLVVAPVTLTVPEVQEPAVSAEPPRLELVAV